MNQVRERQNVENADSIKSNIELMVRSLFHHNEKCQQQKIRLMGIASRSEISPNGIRAPNDCSEHVL